MSALRWATDPKKRPNRLGRVVGQVAIHGGAGDSQHLRDVGGRNALVPELTGFGGIGVVDLAGATGSDAVRFLKIPDSDHLARGRGNDAVRAVLFLGVTAQSEFFGV